MSRCGHPYSNSTPRARPCVLNRERNTCSMKMECIAWKVTGYTIALARRERSLAVLGLGYAGLPLALPLRTRIPRDGIRHRRAPHREAALGHRPRGTSAPRGVRGVRHPVHGRRKPPVGSLVLHRDGTCHARGCRRAPARHRGTARGHALRSPRHLSPATAWFTNPRYGPDAPRSAASRCSKRSRPSGRAETLQGRITPPNGINPRRRGAHARRHGEGRVGLRRGGARRHSPRVRGAAVEAGIFRASAIRGGPKRRKSWRTSSAT